MTKNRVWNRTTVRSTGTGASYYSRYSPARARSRALTLCPPMQHVLMVMFLVLAAAAGGAAASDQSRPWMDQSLPPNTR